MPSSDREPQASLIVGIGLGELSRLSAWVNAWAQHHGFSEKLVHNLDLCSTECVSNIMNYAFDGDEGEQFIALRLDRQGDDVCLQIEDEGRPFDPLQVPPPAPANQIDDTRIGGWGLPLVRHFCDGIRYDREGGRNRLTLHFRATAPP
jgi:anti-sigma regulatory factor (Ser/Thr protein kinase)